MFTAFLLHVSRTASRYVVKHSVAHLKACHLTDLLAEVQSNAQFMLQSRLQDVQTNGMHSFYHHVITRERSEALLAGKPIGTFLIRWSETKHTYCVSFRDPQSLSPSKIEHNLLFEVVRGS